MQDHDRTAEDLAALASDADLVRAMHRVRNAYRNAHHAQDNQSSQTVRRQVHRELAQDLTDVSERPALAPWLADLFSDAAAHNLGQENLIRRGFLRG